MEKGSWLALAIGHRARQASLAQRPPPILERDVNNELPSSFLAPFSIHPRFPSNGNWY